MKKILNQYEFLNKTKLLGILNNQKKFAIFLLGGNTYLLIWEGVKYFRSKGENLK